MNVRHLEAFRPVCPVCRTLESAARVNVTKVEQEDMGHIVEGTLGCSNSNCQHEYPIIDGVPILLPSVRTYVRDNIMAIIGRDDLSATMESMISDCCGPGSPYEHLRQHLSSYAWSHYGKWDPQETDFGEDQSIDAVMESGLHRAGTVKGPYLDTGCAVGGTTFALAEKTNELVLGIDVHFSMLRVAAEVLRSGVVRYPRRRCGIVYDRREFEVPHNQVENVDFWACDAMALPFPQESFCTAVGLHTLDSVASPLSYLENLAQVLTVGGKLILACPYDWTVAVTPVEHWIGGHSQRGQRSGASDQILVDLLTPGAHPAAVKGLQLLHQSDDIKWNVRWHDRGMIEYRVHLVVAERVSDC